MDFPYLVDFDLEKMPIHRTDVLIIGGGIAGLTAALTVAEQLDVQILAKNTARQTSTWYAQGGIAAPLAPDDSPELHFKDTITAGAGLCDPEAVKVMVDEAAGAVEMLLRLGTGFDYDNGLLRLGREGGHSVSRVVHAGDATGSAIVASLGRAAAGHRRIALTADVFVLDLIVEERVCRGAVVYESRTNTLAAYLASATVIAAGGMGQIYEVTTNPPVATGDGQAMAYRRGVKLDGLEFVQFHPTALATPENPRFLISEAVRGEGAFLVDKAGVRFMLGRHPLAELAPRDIVSQAVVEAMAVDRVDHVHLDARHIPAERLRERFPAIWEHCLAAGFDISRDFVPVAPAAHYLVGGIVTDLHGRTDLDGLYASGEVASTGVHGANRLASNSLLEALVFSRRIGVLLNENLEPRLSREAPRGLRVDLGRPKGGPLGSFRTELRRIMSENVGVARTAKGLKDAASFIDSHRHLFEYQYETPDDWETINMLSIAELIVSGALARRKSLGVHLMAG